MSIQRIQITTAAATGSAGSATGEGTTTCPIQGVIYSIHLAFSGSPPVGTTTTILGITAPYTPILAVTGATDAWHHVLHQAVSSADGSDITNQGTLVSIFDSVKVALSTTNEDAVVCATLLYEHVR